MTLLSNAVLAALAIAVWDTQAVQAQMTRLLSQVYLDRPAPVYAVNEALSLTIVAASDVDLEIWEVDVAGGLTQIAPNSAAPAPLRVSAGQTLHFPPAGQRLRVGKTTGSFELKIIARPTQAGTRGLGDAGSRLAGVNVRDERQLKYTVINPGAP